MQFPSTKEEDITFANMHASCCPSATIDKEVDRRRKKTQNRKGKWERNSVTDHHDATLVVQKGNSH